MKTLVLLFVLALSALAEDLPMRMDADLTQGPVTVSCNYLDISDWGGVFRFVPPSFRCNVATTAPDTAEFSVTLTTRDAQGKISTWSSRTAVENGRSIVVFPTKDTVLLSVSVNEVKTAVKFDSST